MIVRVEAFNLYFTVSGVFNQVPPNGCKSTSYPLFSLDFLFFSFSSSKSVLLWRLPIRYNVLELNSTLKKWLNPAALMAG
jgi:hypothetical protein